MHVFVSNDRSLILIAARGSPGFAMSDAALIRDLEEEVAAINAAQGVLRIEGRYHGI
jgi:hypothetical protein